MSDETRTSRRRIVGISAAAVAGVAAAAAGIIGYTRRHRRHGVESAPLEHEKMTSAHEE